MGGVAGLLEEDGGCGGCGGGGRVGGCLDVGVVRRCCGGDRDLADVDGDLEALAGEYRVHYRDVLMGEVGGGGDGEEKDPALEGGC